MKRLNEIEWEKFEALSLEEKRPYLERVEGGQGDVCRYVAERQGGERYGDARSDHE